MAQEYSSFGSYILFKEVVEDGLGHLYRAGEFDKSGVKRTVFLRVFDAQHVPTAELLEQVAASNKIAEVLHAANIAGNSVFFAHEGKVAVAWDYLPAQPLSLVFRKVINEGFPAPVDNALLLLEKLSLALSAGLAVERGGKPLLHGFLHPGLVVISTDGEGIVSGYGMAEQLLALLDDAESARSCAPYLAPEVMLSRTASKRGDVYSLGAILFQLLTGKPLPDAVEARASAVEEAELAQDGEPVPDDIKEMLNRTLAQRPEDRFSSAADFKKELDKLLYGGAYSPTTFNLALFMDRLFRTEIEIEEKEKLVEAEVDVAPYLLPAPVPTPEETDEKPAPTTSNKGLWIGLAAAAVVLIAVAAFLIPKFRAAPVATAPPTPTAEEIAAKKQANDERLQVLINAEVQRLMAAKEQEILQELKDRQQRISDLQRQLQEAEKKVSAGSGPTAAEQQRAAELKRKIEEAEKEQQQREEELERQREQQRKEAEAKLRKLAEAASREPTPVPQIAEVLPTPTQGAPSPAAQVPAQEPKVRAQPPTPTVIPTAQPRRRVAQGDVVALKEVTTPPRLLRSESPVMPRKAQLRRVSGDVKLKVLIGVDGKVESIQFVSVPREDFGFEEAVEDVIGKWRFKPATKDGVVVKAWIQIRIPFTM